MNNNIFNNLFVLDMANNHFGDYNHAKKIVNLFSKIVKKKRLKATIKFQFRNLKTFIHPSQINNKDNHFVKRFLSTEMSLDKFERIRKLIKKNGLLTSCTPFDESSIDKIVKMKFDIMKIASVSSNDWSLLEKARESKIPKIISTGGKTIAQIDKIVSFFSQRNTSFAIMHCTAIYPSSNDTMQLNQINILKKRYKNLVIGWSTHEEPENLLPSTIAYSAGARMFEKHIGLNSKKYKLNNYSITPNQFEKYLKNLENVKLTLGGEKKIISKIEKKTLSMLDRGAYAKKKINKKTIVNKENVYFAFPKQQGQLSSSEISSKMLVNISNKIFKKDEKITKKNIIIKKDRNLELITSYIHNVKGILNNNQIDLGEDFDLEISHHYGVRKFLQYGCFLFNCVNRSYAKKIVVLFANQKHPLHKHKKKEETFQILSGRLISTLNGKKSILKSGDKILVKPGVWHKFRTDKNGCIFEEISTTSYKDDSFYKDKRISKLSRDERKTYVKNWGFGAIDNKYGFSN